jgi:hypothetical protein
MCRIDASGVRSSLRLKRILLLAVLLLAIMGSTVSAAASTVVIAPADAQAQTGKTYGAWSATWWQYVLGISTKEAGNPLLSKTGQDCGEGQPGGNVFFLVGTWGSGTVTRTRCVAPANKYLFFPLVNAIDFHAFPNDGLDTPEAAWADLQSSVFSTPQALYASVDGAAIGNLDPLTSPYRACAGPDARCSAGAFSITLPARNLFSQYGVGAGTYYPAVADGYYLLLAPLPAGSHTIKFGGTDATGGSYNITYVLTIK